MNPGKYYAAPLPLSPGIFGAGMSTLALVRRLAGGGL